MEVASLRDIGDRLATAKASSALTIPELMKAAGADVSAWHRWVNGLNEGGCRQIAILGLMLGLRPDHLLLKVPPGAEQIANPAALPNLTGADLNDLVALSQVVDEMTSMGEGYWKDRPMALLLDHAKGILEKLKEQREFLQRNNAVPLGTQIRKDGDVKVYDAPKKAKGKGDDLATAAEAREDPPEYPRKKRKK